MVLDRSTFLAHRRSCADDSATGNLHISTRSIHAPMESESVKEYFDKLRMSMKVVDFPAHFSALVGTWEMLPAGTAAEPKRPPSAYYLYVADERENIEGPLSDGTVLHFQKGWEALGPERKEEYQSRAEQMQLQYDSQVSEYRENERFDAFAEECSRNDSCSEDGTDSNRDEEVSNVGESLLSDPTNKSATASHQNSDEFPQFSSEQIHVIIKETIISLIPQLSDSPRWQGASVDDIQRIVAKHQSAYTIGDGHMYSKVDVRQLSVEICRSCIDAFLQQKVMTKDKTPR